MAQVIFGPDTTPANGDLDANFSPNFAWRELLNTPAHSGFGAYTALNPKFHVSAEFNFGMGQAPAAWASGWSAFNVLGASVFATSGNFGGLISNAYYDGTNYRYIAGGTATRYVQSGGVHQFDTAVSGSAAAVVSWVNQATIDAAGNFASGVGAASAKMHVRNTVATTPVMRTDQPTAVATIPVHQIVHNATSGDNLFVQLYTDGGPTLRGSIDFNRAGSAVRYNTTSDARLKRDITDAPDAGGIIDAIRVRSFVWRDSGARTEFGFVAQELHTLAPDAVRAGDAAEEVTESSDIWAVDPSKLVPLLVRELQALRKRVAELEAR